MEKKKHNKAQAETTKKVADLTIIEVLKMDLYQSNLASLISQFKTSRKEASKAHRLKAHPIDKLIAKDVFNSGEMTLLYAQILDKVCVGYSASERRFIHDVCTEAFNVTIKAMLDKENAETGNNSDGACK